MQKWYIVMAKASQEHSSISFLGRVGIEPYYPEEKESFTVGGRRRFRRSGLFPGYLFTRFDYCGNLDGSPNVDGMN